MESHLHEQTCALDTLIDIGVTCSRRVTPDDWLDSLPPFYARSSGSALLIEQCRDGDIRRSRSDLGRGREDAPIGRLPERALHGAARQDMLAPIAIGRDQHRRHPRCPSSASATANRLSTGARFSAASQFSAAILSVGITNSWMGRRRVSAPARRASRHHGQ